MEQIAATKRAATHFGMNATKSGHMRNGGE
jgi:hypothetical protein